MNVHMVRAMGFTPAAAKSYAAEKKAEGDVAVEAGDFVAAIAAYRATMAPEVQPAAARSPTSEPPSSSHRAASRRRN